MITWIGLCAGEVWRYLDQHNGEAALEAAIRDIKAPKETILMALGWLAREGHVLLRGDFPDMIMKLNSQHSNKGR